MLRRQPRGHHGAPTDGNHRDGDDRSHARSSDNSFSRERRLSTAAEFAAVLQAPRVTSIRAARSLLTVLAAWSSMSRDSDRVGRVRFGVIVGRRSARRAVDRALVKRIAREAYRHQASAFDDHAAQLAVCLDIVMRLKAPLVDTGGAALAMRQWRRQLRSEADDLLQQVLTALPARVRQPRPPE